MSLRRKYLQLPYQLILGLFAHHLALEIMPQSVPLDTLGPGADLSGLAHSPGGLPEGQVERDRRSASPTVVHSAEKTITGT